MARKLTLSWTDTETDLLDPGYQSKYNNTKAVLSYNDKGLLARVAYTYPPGYAPDLYDYNTTDITYDSDNVLQKMDVLYMDGSRLTRAYKKTLLAGGNYQLEWEEFNPANPGDGTYFRTAVFGAGKKNTKSVIEYFRIETSPSGDMVEYRWSRADTLLYDAAGNVTKILRHLVNSSDNTDEKYVFYEYGGRQTRGDELYNQRRLILAGIDNIPFDGGNDEMVSYQIGLMSFNMDYEYTQYSKFPADRVAVQTWDGSIEKFTFNSTYDSKNRLTNFKGFKTEFDIEPWEYRITYFK